MRRSLMLSGGLLSGAALTLSACNVPVIWMGTVPAADCAVAPTATAGRLSLSGRATVLEARSESSGESVQTEERAFSQASVSLADSQGRPIPGLPTTQTDANGGFTVPDVPASFSYVVVARRTIDQKTVDLKTLVRAAASSSSSVTINAATTIVTEAVTQGHKGLMKDFTVAKYERAVAIVLSYIQTGNVPDLSNRVAMLAWIEALVLRVPELRAVLDELVFELYGASPSPSPTTSPVPAVSPVPSASPSPVVTPSPEPTAAPVSSWQRVVTIAGASGGYTDADGAQAQFNLPGGIAVSPEGVVFVADVLNHTIRRIELRGDTGVVTSFAGNGQNGYLNLTGSEARFYRPSGLARDASGRLIVSDTGNHRIRLLTPGATASLLTGSGHMGMVDGAPVDASFSSPADLAIDASGTVYVSDTGNHRIRKVSPEGAVTTFVGSTPGFADGTGTGARFNNPAGLALDAAGNLYVSDAGNHRIRKVTPDGVVTTIAGIGLGYADGLGTQARFKTPQGLAYDPRGRLIVADQENNRIRAIDLGSPQYPVVTIAGGTTNSSVDGEIRTASFRAPSGVAVDGQGRIYVTEPYTHRVRMIR